MASFTMHVPVKRRISQGRHLCELFFTSVLKLKNPYGILDENGIIYFKTS
jgi:hypothetical protein